MIIYTEKHISLNKTFEIGNNEAIYLISGLHSLGNSLFTKTGKNYSKLNLPKAYNNAKIYNWNIIQIQKNYLEKDNGFIFCQNYFYKKCKG